MQGRGYADKQRVELLARQHLGPVEVQSCSRAYGDRLRPLLVDVADRSDLHIGLPCEHGEVVPDDGARPDEADPHVSRRGMAQPARGG